MTVLELYQGLKEKGYSGALAIMFANQIVEGNNGQWPVMKLWETLELDRREVFRVWFGDTPEDDLLNWRGQLLTASIEYGRGEIDSCIDYLLSQPDDSR